MGTTNEKIVASLNNLVQINNDRIQGYLTAAQETDQDDLKSVFSEMMTSSQECRRELVQEISKLGGDSDRRNNCFR
ncbi:DUF2383 domain-containing protein [Fluviicola taffensis]|uniref:DUF2383 domain-containing protein n=1 Tax=Fluviicola taffensis TaxID=191579 RepID=UPI003137DB99